MDGRTIGSKLALTKATALLLTGCCPNQYSFERFIETFQNERKGIWAIARQGSTQSFSEQRQKTPEVLGDLRRPIDGGDDGRVAHPVMIRLFLDVAVK